PKRKNSNAHKRSRKPRSNWNSKPPAAKVRRNKFRAWAPRINCRGSRITRRTAKSSSTETCRWWVRHPIRTARTTRPPQPSPCPAPNWFKWVAVVLDFPNRGGWVLLPPLEEVLIPFRKAPADWVGSPWMEKPAAQRIARSPRHLAGAVVWRTD